MNSSKLVLPATAIIITNRSDKRFEAALASVQAFEEVLIIDNNSGAVWNDLHKKYHFTKIATAPHPITNFAAARNDSLQFATKEWVFFLDSDEVLTNPSAIKNIFEKTEQQVTAYTITRSDIFLDKPLNFGEAAKQKIVRICKKDSTRFSGQVHEVAQTKGSVAESSGVILHNSHQSISEFLIDVATYTNMLSTKKQKLDLPFFFQMFFYPPLKFFYNYIVKLGFLDGLPGLTYALVMSLHSFWVRVFLYEKNKS